MKPAKKELLGKRVIPSTLTSEDNTTDRKPGLQTASYKENAWWQMWFHCVNFWLSTCKELCHIVKVIQNRAGGFW